MSYTKHDFKSGEKLYAQQLNEMDEQIFKNTEETSKLSEEIADLKENGTGSGTGIITTVEPMGDDIPKVFFTGDTTGMSKENEKILQFSYYSKTKKIDGYCKLKWQGSSSLNFDKKNFTIKMFSDEACETKLEQSFKDWKQLSNKYVLKANYIDHTHARNVITANLWTEIVASRSDYDLLPDELKNSPKNGAIDGFPVKLYMNGKYEGIYTWNIGKDAWMFGIDEENVNHAVLCAEKNNNGNSSTTDRNILACEFRTNANIDGNDWSLEVPDVLQSSIKTSFNNLINCVKDTDDDTFKATIGNYLDITSALDYYILMYFSCAVDNLAKNLIMVTYDGVKWFCSAYDLDNIWGSRGTNTFVDGTFQCPEGYQDTNSLLWQRIEKCFANELYERYKEIRKNVLSFSNVVDKFERFCDLIGTELYKEDVDIYTGIPYPNQNNLKQIRNFFKPRAEYVDSCFEEFINSGGEPEEPDVPDETIGCTGITLNTNTLTFINNDTQRLFATVEPSDTTDEITWVSSDNSVAIVSNGTVIPYRNGDCVITATCGTKSATCSVSVNISEELIQIARLSPTGFDNANWVDDVNEISYPATNCTADNNGVSFNGSNSYVNLVDSPINMINDFKIEFEFTPSNIGHYQVVLGNQNGGKFVTNKITIGTADSNELYIAVVDREGVHKIDEKTSTILSNGTTYTCMIEKKGYNIKICLNEVLMASADDVVFSDSPSFCLGRNGSAANCYYNGIISKFNAYCSINSYTGNLLYSLAEPTTFGNNVVDTHTSLFITKRDFSIALTMTPNAHEKEACLFVASNSIKFFTHPSHDGYNLMFNGDWGSKIALGIPQETNSRVPIVICYSKNTKTLEVSYKLDGNIHTNELTVDFSFSDSTLYIGADDGWSNPVRHWSGVVDSFEMHSRLLSDEEITAYLNR